MLARTVQGLSNRSVYGTSSGSTVLTATGVATQDPCLILVSVSVVIAVYEGNGVVYKFTCSARIASCRRQEGSFAMNLFYVIFEKGHISLKHTIYRNHKCD